MFTNVTKSFQLPRFEPDPSPVCPAPKQLTNADRCFSSTQVSITLVRGRYAKHRGNHQCL